MVGSQVRALVSPPPSPWVETFISLLAFTAPEWGLFASGCVSAGGLCLAEGPAWALSPHQKFPFPARVETGSMTEWFEQVQIVLGASHRDIEQSAFFFNFRRGPSPEIRRHAPINNV
jgi:hypothetical protein